MNKIKEKFILKKSLKIFKYDNVTYLRNLINLTNILLDILFKVLKYGIHIYK